MAVTIHADDQTSTIGLVIFNLDDVILDTSLVFEGALRNTIKDFYPAINLGEYYYMDIEYRLPVSLKLMKLRNDMGIPFSMLEKMDWTFENYAIEAAQYMYIEDHVLECLRSIRERRCGIAVVSNTRKAVLREVIKTTGLNQHIDYVKCAKDADIADIIPDKHVLEYVCTAFKMPRQNTLHIGKALQDSYMALQAGVNSMTVDSVEDVTVDILDGWRFMT